MGEGAGRLWLIRRVHLPGKRAGVFWKSGGGWKALAEKTGTPARQAGRSLLESGGGLGVLADKMSSHIIRPLCRFTQPLPVHPTPAGLPAGEDVF
jgi:hypothetical protein